MAGGLYRRGVKVNNGTPYQQAAPSRGAGGIGGAPVIPPRQEEEDKPVDVSRLGGLLGMMRQAMPAEGVGESGFQGGTAGPDAILNQGSLAQQAGLNGINYAGGMGNGIGNGMPMGIGAQALQGAPQTSGMGAGGMLGGMDFSGGMAGPIGGMPGPMGGQMGGMPQGMPGMPGMPQGMPGQPMGGMPLDPLMLQRMGFGGFGF